MIYILHYVSMYCDYYSYIDENLSSFVVVTSICSALSWTPHGYGMRSFALRGMSGLVSLTVTVNIK